MYMVYNVFGYMCMPVECLYKKLIDVFITQHNFVFLVKMFKMHPYQFSTA